MFFHSVNLHLLLETCCLCICLFAWFKSCHPSLLYLAHKAQLDHGWAFFCISDRSVILQEDDCRACRMCAQFAIKWFLSAITSCWSLRSNHQSTFFLLFTSPQIIIFFFANQWCFQKYTPNLSCLPMSNWKFATKTVTLGSVVISVVFV